MAHRDPVRDAHGIGRWTLRQQGQQVADLAREAQRAGGFVQEHRAHAQLVAREQPLAALLIPDQQREVPAHAGQQLAPPTLPAGGKYVLGR